MYVCRSSCHTISSCCCILLSCCRFGVQSPPLMYAAIQRQLRCRKNTLNRKLLFSNDRLVIAIPRGEILVDAGLRPAAGPEGDPRLFSVLHCFLPTPTPCTQHLRNATYWVLACFRRKIFGLKQPTKKCDADVDSSASIYARCGDGDFLLSWSGSMAARKDERRTLAFGGLMLL